MEETEQTENTDKQQNNSVIGRPFPRGVSGNPNGRPIETPEQKLAKKAIKQIVQEYKDKLTEALPKIEPVLIAKAIRGDMIAIKELHDRVMGKPMQYNDIDLKANITFLPSEILDKNNLNDPSPSTEVDSEGQPQVQSS